MYVTDDTAGFVSQKGPRLKPDALTDAAQAIAVRELLPMTTAGVVAKRPTGNVTATAVGVVVVPSKLNESEPDANGFGTVAITDVSSASTRSASGLPVFVG